MKMLSMTLYMTLSMLLTSIKSKSVILAKTENIAICELLGEMSADHDIGKCLDSVLPIIR